MENNVREGIIFNIQRFSIHDGPGIRTLVFMKGCPLRCRWCSNPEGLTSKRTVLSNVKSCIGCGWCSQACKSGALYRTEKGAFQINRELCTDCLMCARVCPAKSKTISGEVKTVAEILRVVERDRAFYKHSGGGITVGGGEMLAQPEFVHELLSCSRERGLDTAVETSGYGSLTWLLKIADQCDTIHYDIKAIEPQLHKELTGVDNRLILDNLKALSEYIGSWQDRKRELIIRLPMINGYNADQEAAAKAADFISQELKYYSFVEVLAFHNFGESKYEEMGLNYELIGQPGASVNDLKEQAAILRAAGLRIKIPKW